jgi:hypothetical protein
MQRTNRVPDRVWTPLRMYVVPIVAVTTVVLGWVLAARSSVYGTEYTAAEIAAEVFALVLLTVLFLGALEARRFEVDRDGVSFYRLGQRTDLPWDSIEPNFAAAAPNRLPISFRPISSRMLGPNVWLTREQARAMLSDPHAPAWEVPAPLRRSWGLDAPRSGGG